MKTTVVFGGGLGNQMFQYALVMALRSKGHYVVPDISLYNRYSPHNGFELKHVFGINDDFVSLSGRHILLLRALYWLKPSPFVHIDMNCYQNDVLITPPRYLYGYWQDERYFHDIREDICSIFTFRDIKENNKSIAKEIQSCESVSIHIRRGDYKSFGMPLLGEDYYFRAIETIKKRVDHPVFYLFSDDMDEAEKIMNNLAIDIISVNCNNIDESYNDMYLMSQCQHNIIANSTFSWWGAYLNQNPTKIVFSPAHFVQI